MDNKELGKKLEDSNIEMFVDRIQAEQRAIAGYLAGPIIRERSAELISDLLIKSPIFKANKIEQLEIFEDIITIRQGTSKRTVKRTRAMHIRVSDDDKAIARTCLASAYPSKVRGDYPLGIQFRFIPNTSDPDFAVPPSAKVIASRLKAKQASFLTRSISRQNKHFRDIFAKHDYDDNISLLQVLMALKSKRYPDRQLFTCIEQDLEDGLVYFQYAEELEDEADGIIPVIPLFLEGQFGSGVRKWLKTSAEIGTEGYKYDKNNNTVIPKKDNPLQLVNQNWQQRLDNQDEYLLSDDDSEEESNAFVIEFGELDLNNENRKSNLGDDTESLGTLGLADAKHFKRIENDVSSSERSESSDDSSDSERAHSKRISKKDLDLLSKMKSDEQLMKLVYATLNPQNTVSSKQDGDGDIT